MKRPVVIFLNNGEDVMLKSLANELLGLNVNLEILHTSTCDGAAILHPDKEPCMIITQRTKPEDSSKCDTMIDFIEVIKGRNHETKIVCYSEHVDSPHVWGYDMFIKADKARANEYLKTALRRFSHGLSIN